MHEKNYNSCWKHLVWRHQNNISINSCRTNLYQSWIIFQLSFSKPPFQLSPQKTPLFEYSLKKTLVFHGSSGEVWQYIIYWSKWNILVHGISLITCKLCTCKQHFYNDQLSGYYLDTGVSGGGGGGLLVYVLVNPRARASKRCELQNVMTPFSFFFLFSQSYVHIPCNEIQLQLFFQSRHLGIQPPSPCSTTC